MIPTRESKIGETMKKIGINSSLCEPPNVRSEGGDLYVSFFADGNFLQCTYFFPDAIIVFGT